MLSHLIAELSTGTYYDEIELWYNELKYQLEQNGCEVGPLPEIHTDKGRAFIDFTGRETGQVFFTWYKMPSGRWEIVCYRS